MEREGERRLNLSGMRLVLVLMAAAWTLLMCAAAFSPLEPKNVIITIAIWVLVPCVLVCIGWFVKKMDE